MMTPLSRAKIAVVLLGVLAVAGQAEARGGYGLGAALLGGVVGANSQPPVYVQQPVYVQPQPVYVQPPQPVYYQAPPPPPPPGYYYQPQPVPMQQ
ncbi:MULTISPECIES: hypothetical protein [unclassified Pseudomonas]|nr:MULTISPECIES: hypothetical protein [unclassified Pseudomonas]MPQ68764.1 hypothetical protein [Pseudomonas sp. MWU12-2323]